MSGLYTNNTSAQIGVTVTLSIIIMADLIGNTLVILTILSNKSMKSPLNYLLVNLAVADITVGIFIAPRLIFSQFFTHPDGLAGTVLCKLITGGNISWIGVAASVLSLIAISFERYFAIIHPYSTKLKLTTQKVKRLATPCWVLAALINTPLFVTVVYDSEVDFCVEEWPNQRPWLGQAYSTICFIFFGIMPVTIMFVLYSRVVYTLWFKRSTNRVQGTQLAILKSRKRVTKMIVTVSVIYGICLLPDATIYILISYGVEHSFAAVAYICGVVLVSSNSAINPFIYTFQSEKFRQHFKELVCGRTHQNRVQSHCLDTADQGKSLQIERKTAEHSV